jgi:hypothetical protein
MDDFEFGDIFKDKIGPEIEMVRCFDKKEIHVQFSEPIDLVFSEFLINYQLSGVEPINVSLEADSLVHLTFDSKLDN